MTDQENDILWKSYFYPGTNILINNYTNLKNGNKLTVINTFISDKNLLIFKRILELSDYYRIRVIPVAWIFTIAAVIVTTAYAMVAPIEMLYRLNPINALRMTDEYKTKRLKRIK